MGWRVSLYTWTKGLAAGGLLVPVLLILAGQLSWASPLARWAAPGAAVAFLAATGVLLIWDLRHPWRFYLIFTRHHWRSWLVRGSFIIGGYGAALALYATGSLAGLVVRLSKPHVWQRGERVAVRARFTWGLSNLEPAAGRQTAAERGITWPMSGRSLPGCERPPG